ncbi:MAG: methyltransferase domain-containing protein [Bacteroidetes bacterium]|nr:methyltransferase domain-containing protein [Bacteroidota bacterium]
MIFECLKLSINIDDDAFNTVYPEKIRTLAKRHWTPVEIAKRAAAFLVDKPGTKVLDIGSGVGKFCLVGASCTKGNFTGIEHRKALVDLSNKISRNHRIQNTNFINANIISIKFKEYEAFYFYNSFHENVDMTAKIDDNIQTSFELYNLYHTHVYNQLSLAPIGTRLATYWSTKREVPSSYHLKFSYKDGLLLFWEKTS